MQSINHPLDREGVPDAPNPAGIVGLEFVEYSTAKPQAFGSVLERMGFQPVARHRSREVVLYRQGAMNLVVNAHHGQDGEGVLSDEPVLSGVAFRVHDAERARQHVHEAGGWGLPSQAQTMELAIPAIRGPAGSRFYFVDRFDDFSIFDIDFRPIPTVDPNPTAIASMNYFGIVQYVGLGRARDWIAFYQSLLGFSLIPDHERFGVLPKGKLLRSPCASFLWQLVEPPEGAEEFDYPEELHRVGLGTRDVAQAVSALRSRGIEFVESSQLHALDRGALTRQLIGSVAFELVHRD